MERGSSPLATTFSLIEIFRIDFCWLVCGTIKEGSGGSKGKVESRLDFESGNKARKQLNTVLATFPI